MLPSRLKKAKLSNQVHQKVVKYKYCLHVPTLFCLGHVFECQQFTHHSDQSQYLKFFFLIKTNTDKTMAEYYLIRSFKQDLETYQPVKRRKHLTQK